MCILLFFYDYDEITNSFSFLFIIMIERIKKPAH